MIAPTKRSYIPVVQAAAVFGVVKILFTTYNGKQQINGTAKCDDGVDVLVIRSRIAVIHLCTVIL
jgi:hypothetical protein